MSSESWVLSMFMYRLQVIYEQIIYLNLRAKNFLCFHWRFFSYKTEQDGGLD